MTTKTATLAVAFALGALAAAPLAALSQDAPAVPAATLTPSTGVSTLRFGDRHIEVKGLVQMVATANGAVLVLPDGADPLPGDLFDAVKLADGRTGYALKSKDPINLSYAVDPAPSLIPTAYKDTIEATGEPVTKLGIVMKGETLVSIPYRYKRPLRMREDLSISGLFGTRVLATKGEVGFDAGEFSGGGTSHHLLCFFNPTHAQPYAVPDCFVKYPAPDGSFGLAQVDVVSNLPLDYKMSRFQANGAQAPAVDSEGVTIDHDFHLELVPGWWRDHKLELSWRSDGQYIAREEVPADDNGVVKVRLKNGYLLLRNDPREHVKTLVEFAPDQ